MKRLILPLLFLLSISFSYAQNNWDLVWYLDQKPFQDPQAGSEMAIVKAGFDTDQDGWGEFLCAYTDLDSNYLLMYEATGDDTYDLVWYFKYPVPANSFAGIAVGDIDNNGIVDIVTTMPSSLGLDPNPPRLWVFEWSGVVGENLYGNYTSGTMEPTNSWNFDLPDATDFRPYSLTIEDIDKDGTNELIAGIRQRDNSGTNRQVLVASVIGQLSGFGSWDIEYSQIWDAGGSLYNVTTGDLDGDGNTEIYAFIWNKFTLKIIECVGDRQYNIAVELDELYSSASIDYGALDAVRVADVDNNGVNELYIAATEPPNSVFIITNINDVSQITPADVNLFYTIPPKAGGKLRSMYIADPDNDGLLDLMIGGELNGQIYDMEYKGIGDPADSNSWNLTVCWDIWDYSGFDPTAVPTISPRLFYGHPADDMDKDGKNEYVFVNYSSDFSVWSGDGYVWMIEAESQASGLALEENSLPEKFSLEQNYPNPFNPSTTIRFSIPEPANVRLQIFNSLGEIVGVLVNEELQSGTYNYNWDASGLSSGIYFYRLEAGDYMQSKKLTLLK